MDIFQNPQKSDEGIVYYATRDVSTKPLLLVHGSFGSARMWSKYVPMLTAAGHSVVALDLPGHGASEGELSQLNMDSYVASIESVARISYSKPIIVGHSMAGLLALMAAKQGIAEQAVAIDPSPSQEIQGEKSTKDIPDVYNPEDVGMPEDMKETKEALGDMNPNTLKRMKHMLGPESGVARRQRKAGISIPKNSLTEKGILFIAAENGDSVPFGISLESTQEMAEFYDKPIEVIAEATHPGVLMGNRAEDAVQAILDFLS